MNGFGRYTYANGQIYEGNYVNGIKEGKGKLTYPNGFVYDGDFIGGRPRGNANIIKVQTIPNATVDFATLKMPFGRLIYLNTEGVSVPSDQGPSESLGSSV